MIIDFHTHIFSPQIQQDRGKYIEKDPCFALMYSDKKARLASAEELIEKMDKDDIDISVVLNIGWTTHELCVETNDYILEAINRYPSRLVGFCAVQPGSMDSTLDEIKRCVDGGIKGIGELRPDMQMINPNDDEVINPFFEALNRNNLILLIHASEPVGHQYPGKGNVTPELIYPLIAGYSDSPGVCAHWGGGLPFYALMPEVKAALSNVFFDTAASPFLYSSQVYSQVVQLVGADKILFGSDFPLLAPHRLLEEINSLDLPAETKNLILSENARQLLNI